MIFLRPELIFRLILRIGVRIGGTGKDAGNVETGIPVHDFMHHHESGLIISVISILFDSQTVIGNGVIENTVEFCDFPLQMFPVAGIFQSRFPAETGIRFHQGDRFLNVLLFLFQNGGIPRGCAVIFSIDSRIIQTFFRKKDCIWFAFFVLCGIL